MLHGCYGFFMKQKMRKKKITLIKFKMPKVFFNSINCYNHPIKFIAYLWFCLFSSVLKCYTNFWKDHTQHLKYISYKLVHVYIMHYLPKCIGLLQSFSTAGALCESQKSKVYFPTHVFLSSSSDPLTKLQRDSSLHFTEYMWNVHRGQRAPGHHTGACRPYSNKPWGSGGGALDTSNQSIHLQPPFISNSTPALWRVLLTPVASVALEANKLALLRKAPVLYYRTTVFPFL